MTNLVRDLKLGLRLLLTRPGFTAIAVATLGLGIGANTAIFSVVKGMLLDTVPFEEPGTLVALQEISESFGRMSISYPNFVDWRERHRVFEAIAAHRQQSYNLTSAGGRPETVRTAQVSAELFSILRAKPLHGRTFTPDEDRPGGPKVAILSYGLWQRRFGGRTSVLGETMLLDAEPYEVVGVMPQGFLYPLRDRQVKLYLPIGQFSERWMEHRGNHPGIRATARLKPDVDLETAQADMARVAAELETEYPDSNTGNSVYMTTLQERMVRGVREAVLVLGGAVLLVLLIACVNVANLLLVRGAARGQEMAVRGALGADRWQIVRQLLAESVLLGLASGVAGIAVGFAGIQGLLAMIDLENLPLYGEISLNPTVLGFALALSALTGLVFGLAPAIQALRYDFVSSLKEGVKGSGGPGRHRLQNGLVVAEMALALVLLIGAVLFMRTFYRIVEADSGIDPKNILTFRVNLPRAVYSEPAEQRLFFERTIERLEALPGVESAATTLPLLGGWQSSFSVEGQEPPPPGEEIHTEVLRVSPHYFDTMGMQLLYGQTFTAEDHADSRRVVVIDKVFAETIWPGEDPLGGRVKFGDPEDEDPWLEVIGVVNHVKSYGVQEDSRMELYMLTSQEPLPFATVVVKTAVPPIELAGAAESAVLELDASMPVDDVRTMEERLAAYYAGERYSAILLTIFSVLALVLSAVGIYGVISYSVTERRREIGIRMALGAGTGAVQRLVILSGLRLVLTGVTLGLGMAALGTPLVESLLFGIEPRDPATFLTLPLALSVVALLACAGPAWRASQVEPILALHYE